MTSSYFSNTLLLFVDVLTELKPTVKPGRVWQQTSSAADGIYKQRKEQTNMTLQWRLYSTRSE